MAQPFLEVREGKIVRQFPIDKEKLTIGRHAESNIVLDDTQASRNHCVIEKAGEDYLVRDLSSRNGTRVNGMLIATAALTSNDVITIGQTTLRFMAPTEFEETAELLSAEDLVDPVSGDGGGGMPFMGKSDEDYEVTMEKLANALPDQGFYEADIELVNARGGIVHQSGQTNQSNRGKDRREAVEVFRLLLLVCFRSRASDIHIEPKEDGFQTRLRIDGTMVDVMKVPLQFGIKLTTLVKVLSDIDIAQRNAIQEGHFTARVPAPKGKDTKLRVDYRVSFAPSLHGQKLVIRILDTSTAPLRIADLQLPLWMYDEVGAAIRQDSGMILVSGPTGSGKTTSLYALVRSIETTKRNVVTIEDPVEIQLENVTQIPVDEAHDKSFSQLLRSVLRQDPDVLLVGEVRDAETARIAMQAAITGHLVFSTIHTKDTIGTIFRLLDLGVEPYLIAQALHIVLAQRLVRKLCPYCKRPVSPTPAQRAAMGPIGEKVDKIYIRHGCARCMGTGFAGRQAFFELLRFNDKLRDVILGTPSMQELQAALANTKFTPLSQNAYQLVASGVSPFDEVERIIGRE
jgi:type II secretory ATPase GspE/PulE/Tfp pilus assembly ATPase PilB-like protein